MKLLSILLSVGFAAAQTTFRFDFTASHPAPYSAERGYGLEPGSDIAKAPFYFSVRVPGEGNYKVTVRLGDPNAASVTTVKAELRRLMLERVRTAPGEFATRNFIVNVRRPQIAGGGEVRLKDREKTSEAWAWDDKLTLEFIGEHPAVAAIDIEKAGAIPTIYIAGDSTSTDQPSEPFNSWGQMLTRFFRPEIAVANHGESGESLKGFVGERRLAKVLSVIQPGDYLFIQMGHNDQKERGEGVGAFTTYKADLKRFIDEARSHGATPVLITSMNRLTFDDAGKITNSLGDYPEAVRQAAAEEKVALIDLNAMSKPFYEALGPVEAHKAFAGKDTTHHSDYGSYELAKCIVEGIRQARLPIAKYLYDTPRFDPAHPDPVDAFDIPAEPPANAQRPYGDVGQAPAPPPAPAAAASAAPGIDAKLPTVFVIGDSTASNVNRRGWGDPFADYFDRARINVVNRARAGRSSRTFQTEGLWDRVLADLKAGDFVLIQFGHNDGGPPDKDRARGSLPGLGDESREFTLPDGKKETVHTFGFYMRKFIADTKAKGATPIVLSLTVRNIWTGAAVERGNGKFSQWSAEIAKTAGVTFLDETNAIADAYERMGAEKVKEFFPEDHTHTTPEGADLNASVVVAALKGARSPLVSYLSAKGLAVAPYPITLSADRSSLHLPVPANPNLPTLFLIGDSTVRNGHGDGANGQWGWGEPIVNLFDSAKINVVNRAVGGLSSRTYLTQGDWDRVLAMLKPGDFVMMQFGHNDNGPLDDAARARGTIKGTGDETQEIDNPITRQHEVVHTYGWYLKKFIGDAKARGATAIVCSPIPRKTWKDGKISRDPYAKWAADVAAAAGVAFVDLNEIIARRYDEMGPEKVEAMFADPHTHTSRAGAELNAECVVAGLKGLKENPLGRYLK
jgi:lysophospholipase L1-like esterase